MKRGFIALFIFAVLIGSIAFIAGAYALGQTTRQTHSEGTVKNIQSAIQKKGIVNNPSPKKSYKDLGIDIPYQTPQDKVMYQDDQGRKIGTDSGGLTKKKGASNVMSIRGFALLNFPQKIISYMNKKEEKVNKKNILLTWIKNSIFTFFNIL